MSKKFTIDSTKIFIPIDRVEVLSSELKKTYITLNGDTGEVLKEWKNEAHLIEDKKEIEEGIFQKLGVKTRVAIAKNPNTGNEFLVVNLNAKILKSKEYLQGIHWGNIERVFSNLMEYEVFKCTFETFLNGCLSDTDIKADNKLKEPVFKSSIDTLELNTKPSSKADEGSRKFWRKGNKGIQWSKRETTAFISNPFFKIYHKLTELSYKSNAFLNEYLKGADAELEDLVRTEYTIKNQKHQKSLGIEGNTLRNFLDLTDDKLAEIMQVIVSKHIKGTELEDKKYKTDKKLGSMEKMLHFFIMDKMQGNQTYSKIRDWALRNVDLTPVERSRMKKRLDTMYYNSIEGTNEDICTKGTDKFLGFLGVK